MTKKRKDGPQDDGKSRGTKKSYKKPKLHKHGTLSIVEGD